MNLESFTHIVLIPSTDGLPKSEIGVCIYYYLVIGSQTINSVLYILQYTITIDKEGCYLEVTLVIPSSVGLLLLLYISSTALGNLQVTPLVIYSNVHTVHSTALQELL